MVSWTFSGRTAARTRAGNNQNTIGNQTPARKSPKKLPKPYLGAFIQDTHGASKLLEQLATSGTAKRPRAKLEAEVEGMGATLEVNAGREQTSYTMSVMKSDLKQVGQTLGGIVWPRFCGFSPPWGPRRVAGAPGKAPARKIVRVAPKIRPGGQF